MGRAVSRHKLHAGGPDVSRLVWGAWRSLKAEETDTPSKLARFIEGCLEIGITTFDHADVYGGYRAEAQFGAALREWNGPRESIQIVTKCGIALVSSERPAHRVKHYDTSAGHIRASIDRSLANLRTDVIDLLLIHRPDPLMDADDAAGALEEAVRSGKVRAVGVSNHAPGQLDLLQSRLSIPLVTNQVEFSVLETGALFDGTLDQAQRLRQSPMIWSPLGGGELFRPGAGSERQTALLAALNAVARDLGVPGAVGAVALAFVLKHPSRPVPVLGTSRLERLRSYVLAEDLAAALDRQQWFSILEASRGAPVP